MAAPTPDAALSNLVAAWPCWTRRWLGRTGNTALFINYDFHPWKGQYRDTPVGTPTRWTTDDDVLTPGV